MRIKYLLKLIDDDLLSINKILIMIFKTKNYKKKSILQLQHNRQ
jgi:hypothetical protein